MPRNRVKIVSVKLRAPNHCCKLSLFLYHVKYSFIISRYVWDSNYKLPVANCLNVRGDKTFQSYGHTNGNPGKKINVETSKTKFRIL
jgi:hypothetical protein